MERPAANARNVWLTLANAGCSAQTREPATPHRGVVENIGSVVSAGHSGEIDTNEYLAQGAYRARVAIYLCAMLMSRWGKPDLHDLDVPSIHFGAPCSSRAQKGDRVAIMMPNVLQYRSHARCAGFNATLTRSTPRASRYQLADCHRHPSSSRTGTCFRK
jgi:hypothetical protein